MGSLEREAAWRSLAAQKCRPLLLQRSIDPSPPHYNHPLDPRCCHGAAMPPPTRWKTRVLPASWGAAPRAPFCPLPSSPAWGCRPGPPWMQRCACAGAGPLLLAKDRAARRRHLRDCRAVGGVATASALPPLPQVVVVAEDGTTANRYPIRFTLVPPEQAAAPPLPLAAAEAGSEEGQQQGQQQPQGKLLQGVGDSTTATYSIASVRSGGLGDLRGALGGSLAGGGRAAPDPRFNASTGAVAQRSPGARRSRLHRRRLRDLRCPTLRGAQSDLPLGCPLAAPLLAMPQDGRWRRHCSPCAACAPRAGRRAPPTPPPARCARPARMRPR